MWLFKLLNTSYKLDMKQFIYLDTDITNSIVAQHDQGLINNIEMQNGKVDNKNESSSISSATKGGINGGLLGIFNAEAKVKLESEKNKDIGSSSSIQEIIEKTFHDSIFDKAYKYLKEQEILDGAKDNEGCRTKINDEYGEYVELKRVFEFIDLNYLEELFSKNGVMDLVSKIENEKLTKDLEKDLNRAQRRMEKDITKNKINESSKKANKDTFDIIHALNSLIPYGRMLISSDGYLIPMEEKYFRINPKGIGFMYGGDVTCVGMITNIIGTNIEPTADDNIFAQIQYGINELVKSILPTKKDDICVIHPIAIYYE